MSKSKTPNLKRQANQRLNAMQRYGESKHKARQDEHTQYPEGIFSFNTMKTYKEAVKTFLSWARTRCSEYKFLDDLKEKVPEYLEEKKAAGLSACTIKTYASALAKLYGCKKADFGVEFSKRERKNVKRSRFEPDKKLEKANPDIVDFVRGTGLRRCELSRLIGEDVYRDSEGKLVVHVRRGKGGKERTVTVLAEYVDRVEEIAGKVGAKEKIFKKLHRGLQLHHYRGDFAAALYKKVARSEIPDDDKYIMRKDRKGTILDKKAMLTVSRALGHNRINVIAQSYLYSV